MRKGPLPIVEALSASAMYNMLDLPPVRSEREEDFYQISVDVKGKGSLEKSLESYVQVCVWGGPSLSSNWGCWLTSTRLQPASSDSCWPPLTP